MNELLPMAEAIYEAHIAPLVKERDQLKRELGTVLDVRDQLAAMKEQYTALKTQLHWLCETIAAHEIESLSCDRDGETYCDCLKKEAEKSAAYLKTIP